MHFYKLISRYGSQIFFLLIFVTTTAQENDSIAFGKNDIPEKVRLFIKESDSIDAINTLISNTLSEDKNPKLAMVYGRLFLERGIQENNEHIKYLSSYQLAYMGYLKSDYNTALRNAIIASDSAEKLKDVDKIIGSNVLLGSVYYLIGSYDNALEPYLRAKELSREVKNLPYLIVCLTNIANARMKLNRYKDALESFNSILETLEKEKQDNFLQYKETYLSSLLGKGRCLTELTHFDEAITALNQGVLQSEKNDLPEYKSYFYINFGDVYYQKEEYYKALGFLNEGKDILKTINEGQQTNLYIANFYIARCYFKINKPDQALQELKRNFNLIGDNFQTDKIEDMYQLAVEISKASDNQEQQIYYYDKLQSVIKYKNSQQLKAKDILYEDDIKDFRIRNEKLAAENTKTITNKNIILAISIILIMGLLLVFMIYRQRTKASEQKFLNIIESIQDKELNKTKKVAVHLEIEDQKARKILDKLQELEDTCFYLSPDCNLYSTAKLLNTNTTYLSKALNETRKQSFNQYINELRVNYALLKLKDDSVFRSYTIRAVAKELGYKSHTTFIKVFKSKTGVNPAYYINKLEVA
ncbi:tetratricopeptide repeat protein [Aquimarina litoralis]|uniref:tetratricopeptide repeat protein n=1 Tax=Aquimarina litoralis TaxID=584605 RepID=UPI001C57E319|nr:tetratricopeptide repeat protein [Aquimarina litoralis]MBW1297689.1 tetratricopeptide repeat protein [Aquimarina litoralis]